MRTKLILLLLFLGLIFFPLALAEQIEYTTEECEFVPGANLPPVSGSDILKLDREREMQAVFRSNGVLIDAHEIMIIFVGFNGLAANIFQMTCDFQPILVHVDGFSKPGCIPAVLDRVYGKNRLAVRGVDMD